ncbi:MAG: 30S ribosomal protein S7 [Anaerolineales bacterium]|nr:30S ribosomal protein S7 [Anaerolineales bacterium]MCW5856631.1 30S ribosomal protein S7 [Anaerolineales bacterium]MCW5879295.1 30S ribosomal protein S7 [Anaerolineales bacterium]
MARRQKPEKRIIAPDARFSSVEVQMFINRVMRGGKKSTAARQVYGALDLIEKQKKQNPMEVFSTAFKNVGPQMEVRPRRVGGATYQVPMEVNPERQFALASRWIIASARGRGGKSFSEKLAAELSEAAAGQGASVRKKDETHKMAEANRAFSHYRV